MKREEIATLYSGYIDCLNRQDWGNLRFYVDDDVRRNDVELGLDGYKAILVEDFKLIPDLKFNIELLVCEPPMIASRLAFDCSPVGTLFDLPINGKRIQFSENVFYKFERGRIRSVWSVIDKAAVAAQLC